MPNKWSELLSFKKNETILKLNDKPFIRNVSFELKKNNYNFLFTLNASLDHSIGLVPLHRRPFQKAF